MDNDLSTDEIYWKFYEENMKNAFHHETQRFNATNILLIITGILIGVINHDNKITPNDFFLSLLITGVGFYGILLTLKHHERFLLHYNRAETYKQALDTNTKFNIIELEKKADKKTKQENDYINSEIRLNKLYNGIHIFIILIGVILMFLSISQC